MSLAQVLAQANQEPQQCFRKMAQRVIVNEEENSSKSENERVLACQSARNQRLTKCYLEQDLSIDEESD